MTSKKSNSLQRLGKLDKYEVASENPDVRGWAVMGADGEKLGKVDELIVDPGIEKVRYLDISLDNDLFTGEENKHILIPIGAARLHGTDNVVLVNSLDRSRVREFPEYRGESISRDLEHKIRSALRNEKPSPDQIRGSSTSQGQTAFDRKKYEQDMNSADPLVKLKAERDIARAERDIARAELELMKIQQSHAGTGTDENFYENDYYDDDRFFESRRRKT